LTPDLPGHGAAAPITATLDETADMLAELLPGGPVAVGGYSYGARVALHLALRHGHRLSHLVLLGATRGIEDDETRLERRKHDEALARRIEEIGTRRFLDEWLAQPMFAALPDDERERASRSLDPMGLARSLRSSGTGTQRWLAPMLATINVPTLAMAGSNDLKFTLEADAIARGVGNGVSAVVPDAGHAAHLEQPERSASMVSAFVLSER